MRRRAFLAVAAGLVLIAGLEGSASPTPPPGFLSAIRWTMDDPRFGGFSGIEVAGNGRDIIVLSDKGAYTTGKITRDATTGRIKSIAANPISLLQGVDGKPLKPGSSDSEGIALAPDGSVYISFEGVARVQHYPKLNGPAQGLPVPRDFKAMQRNSALEALAIDAKGVLYTLPERSGAEQSPFPVYRFKAGKWDKRLQVPRKDGYLAVGADFGPDGKFYLLERDFRGLAGFSSRLRRFTLSAKGFDDGETLLQTPVGLYDNLEGVSIWRDAAGHLTATMVSDDNFQFFLRTEIVEYQLPD
ncbi:MAG: esterase-like activity of phytase family protein [Cypionkella sp.]|uniref:esterase-like activity of phytase family protein n=1 Tax=Cypionkella sp. TaxID=2811411 RepID=UPI002AB8AB20|nr:esterase-like activity of phytase family protein [Cypionkella sp.]MDZ4309094.1 esterase-like activity of phytase family protein [Cypionkella sp.]MDZ4395510.1 esterase-like activity of phytase family protein [Cypionkella sp.]